MTHKFLDDNAMLFLLLKLKETFALKGGAEGGGVSEEGVREIAEEVAQSYGFQTAGDVLAAIENALAEKSVGFLQYKGGVATYADLPTGYGAENNGWLYDVSDTQEGYYWFADRWERLDFSIDMTAYWSKAELSAMSNADVEALIEEAGL